MGYQVTAQERAYVERLYPLLQEIKNPDTKDGTIRCVVRMWKESGFKRIEDVPWLGAGFAGGAVEYRNLDHANQVAGCAVAVARWAQEVMGAQVNMDYLISGALLMDFDKILMSRPEGEGYVRTDIGRYVAHGVYAQHVALEEGLPLEVAHIIPTHSKGSNVAPKTMEAVIMHHCDYLVADMRLKQMGVEFLFAGQAPKFSSG